MQTHHHICTVIKKSADKKIFRKESPWFNDSITSQLNLCLVLYSCSMAKTHYSYFSLRNNDHHRTINVVITFLSPRSRPIYPDKLRELNLLQRGRYNALKSEMFSFCNFFKCNFWLLVYLHVLYIFSLLIYLQKKVYMSLASQFAILLLYWPNFDLNFFCF